MTKFVTVEINGPDERTAIAEALVSRRLAAAANIRAPVRGLHHWRGRIERAGADLRARVVGESDGAV